MGTVATCTAGASGGVGDVAGEVASTIAASAAAAAKTAGARWSGFAIATSALETPVRSDAVGLRCVHRRSVKREDSRIGTASRFSMPGESWPASPATAHPAKTTVPLNAANIANRCGLITPSPPGSP